MKKFVIFGHPRSGSNYLCSLLDSHPHIICHYEVFHDQKIIHSFKKNLPFTMEERDSAPIEFINKIFEGDSERQAVGFKIFRHQSPETQKKLLNDRSIKKILLSRKNIIQTYVSLLIARKTIRYVEAKNSPEQARIKVTVDADELLKFNEFYNAYLSNLKLKLEETNQEYMQIYYEDLFEPSTIDSVFRFLNVEKGEYTLEAWTRKQNPAALKDKVSNIEALKQELRGTHLEKFFEDESVLSPKLPKEVLAELAEKNSRIMEMDRQLAEKNSQIIEMDRQLVEKNSKIMEMDRQLVEKDSQIQALRDSWSWRITAPLRKAADLSRSK